MDKQTTKKKSSVKRNGLIAAAAVLVLIIAIVVVGLVMFFQSPEKKIADGLANLIKAKSIGVEGTMVATSSLGDVTATVSGQTDKKVAGADIAFQYTTEDDSKLDGKVQSIVDQDGTLYVKLDDPKKFTEQYADTFLSNLFGQVGGSSLTPEQRAIFFAPMRQSIVNIGDKLDDRWIKITESDIQSFTGESGNGTDCYIAFSQKLDSDKSARNNLAAAYVKYRFIKIETSVEDDEYGKGYTISLDQAKLKDFKDAVSDNAAVKELGSCGLDVLTLGANSDMSDQSIDIWMNDLSNEITRVRYTKPDGERTTAVDMKLSYNVPVDVSTPADATTLEEVLPTLLGTQ